MTPHTFELLDKGGNLLLTELCEPVGAGFCLQIADPAIAAAFYSVRLRDASGAILDEVLLRSEPAKD